MLWFRSAPTVNSIHRKQQTQPTEMELQVLHLEGIPSSVFSQPAPEISHGIDKLVCDLQEQLQNGRKVKPGEEGQ